MKTRVRFIALGLALGLLFLAVHVAPAWAERPAQTIFLYFVGSDLESDHGLASSDMAEIAYAAAANPNIRLLAYVGGARAWRSFIDEGENAILVLEKGGWSHAASLSERNMCDPDTLSAFLHYGVEHYPADSYALLLWNHGAGPMGGYGQDERFGNDSLTLVDIKRALANSPFGADAPAGALLEWIGFDACLMSSIETAHAVAPYARYMIASQEIVPGRGWGYRFLADMNGRESGADIGGRVIQRYFARYEAISERYPEFKPQLTLSCLDLGALGDVERALDALAGKMVHAIHGNDYSDLVRTRLATSDYGRFSTGSELDLVDLQDMARGYAAQFPRESQGLLEALKPFVVHSDSNGADTGGVSIYFPFYNKEHYRYEWGTAYEELAFSPGYTAFLQAYAGVWLGERLTDGSKRALPPVHYGEGPLEFTLQLTSEQQENFASARYVILSRSEGERYHFLFSSEDVVLEEGLLRANYDGRALFSRDPADGELGSALPFREIENTEDLVRYLVYAVFSMPIEGEASPAVADWVSVDFQLEYDKQSGETRIVGIIPRAEDGVAHGKRQLQQADADFIILPHLGDRYKTVADDGTPLPYAEWAETSTLFFDEYNTERTGGAGVEFVMADASAGEKDLYLMLEIRDTQGNAAASGLLPVFEAEEEASALPPPTPRAVETFAFPAGSAEAVVLFDRDGVKLTLSGTAQDFSRATLLIRIENRTGRPLELSVADGASVNDCHLGSGGMYFAQADGDNRRVWRPLIEAGAALDLRLDTNLSDLRKIRQSTVERIEFALDFRGPGDYKPLFSTGPLRIETEWDLKDIGAFLPEPLPGLITPQEIAIGEDVRVHLLSAAIGDDSGGPEIQLRTENESGYDIVLTVERASADGYMMEAKGLYDIIQPGKRAYGALRWDRKELARVGLAIPQGVEFELFARIADTRQILARSGMVSVAFDAPDAGPGPGEYPEIVVFDLDGLHMTIQRQAFEAGGDTVAMYRAYVQNGGDADIEIKAGDAYLNGTLLSRFDAPYLRPFHPVVPGKRAVYELKIDRSHLQSAGAPSLDSLSIRFLVIDAERQELLHTSEAIRLIP